MDLLSLWSKKESRAPTSSYRFGGDSCRNRPDSLEWIVAPGLRKWFTEAPFQIESSSFESSSDQKDSAMSEPSSVGPEKSSPPKKPISPARNIVGLAILAAVLVVCWFEYSAVLGFNAAVKALEARTNSEEQNLATEPEAEALLSKAADGPGEDFKEDVWNFTKKTYTWKGVLKQHTLTAYYTKEKEPKLHHFETEGSKYDLKANQPPVAAQAADGGAPKSRGGGNRGGASKGKSKAGGDAKGKSSEPSDKDKDAAPKAESVLKAATPPKTQPSDKVGAPKTEPAADPGAKAKSSDPDGKSEPPK
jgi:hypothetical protein